MDIFSQSIAYALMGGVLIGLASVVMLLLLGRIAGISGIVKQAIFCEGGVLSSHSIWRWLFLLGIVMGTLIAHHGLGVPFPKIESGNILVVIVSGLLVGVGVSIGSGCTSGHGICGISRFSIRSVVATCCFMFAGIVTVFVTRHIL